MRSKPCDPLRGQGYQFVREGSTAAVKPCLWCKRALRGGEMCYKHQFYGIESHRCVQMTPTLRCNHRCLFCWRSFEHEAIEAEECPPEIILDALLGLQKKALSGYKVSKYVTKERCSEALEPRHVAISLSGEPTLYQKLPELIDLFSASGYSTFLVTNGTNPDILRACRPTQLYVSLNAPDRDTYLDICRPVEDGWDEICESLTQMGRIKSAVRVTLVKGINDFSPDKYASLIQDSGATFVEVKGYMHLGYSRHRLLRSHMPEHDHVRGFAAEIATHADYYIRDENPLSRVVCLERRL
ncbi:MAG: 4-demethylwyosine synthase TYW1 [Methanoregulaceae archaeon]|nr:4-demethylwyosine synthase TYW1 [Methanoregulaceae archaeon]